MPITRGAIKTNRSSQKKRVFNIRRKTAMLEVVKKVRKHVLSGDAKAATELLPNAFKAIDKAAKRGIIKDNTAARKKSRLATAINRLAK